MMKTIKYKSGFLFFVIAATMLVACDDDSDGNGSDKGQSGGIVGTWYDSSATEDLLYTFGSDGSYLCEVYDYYSGDTYLEEWGSYKTGGYELTIYSTDSDGDSDVSVGTYSIRGDDLTIEWEDGYKETWTRYIGGSEPEGDDNDLLVGYWECNYNGSYFSYAFDSDGTYNYEYISAYGTNNVSEYGKYVYRKDLQQVYFEVINTTSQFGGDHSNECILSSDGRSFRMGELTYRKS